MTAVNKNPYDEIRLEFEASNSENQAMTACYDR
jgi:hypothetical protein